MAQKEKGLSDLRALSEGLNGLLGLGGNGDDLPLVQKMKRLQAEKRGRQTGGAVAVSPVVAGRGEDEMAQEVATKETETNGAAAGPAAATAKPIAGKKAENEKKAEKTPADVQRQETFRLLKRAQDGDERTRPEIQAWLADRAPEGLQPAAGLARDALLRAMCSTNILLEEDLRRQMGALHTRLAGAPPSPLESLLAERIVTCWLHLHYYETLAAQSLKDQSLRQSEAHGKRIEQAHRRYLSAIKALAQIRRLEMPSVQVNIGEKQIIGQTQNIADKQVNVTGG